MFHKTWSRVWRYLVPRKGSIHDVGSVYDDLQNALSDLEVLKYKIDHFIEAKQPKPKKSPAAPPGDTSATAVAAFKNIVKSPKRDLPTYDGENIGEYQPFKDKWQFMIKLIPGPKELGLVIWRILL